MKTLLSTISLAASLFSAQAVTWTFHGFKDNWLWVELDPCSCSTDDYYYWQWDWDYDQTNPPDSGSGYSPYGSQFPNLTIGYQDTWTADLDEKYSYLWVSLEGPYPGYYGGGFGLIADVVYAPGDYWFDFTPYGTLRISTSLPDDFGKWAWDGSINPNYVAPLAVKKHHGKHTSVTYASGAKSHGW